jgi:signal peptidase II
VANIELHQTVNVIDPVLRITFLENHQGIFGLNYGPGIIYIILSVAALSIVVVFFLIRPQTRLVTVLMGMILGGGFSNNLIDRIRLGYVVDWIDMGLRNWRFWGVYNIADACIVVPVILLLIYELFWGKKRKQDEKSQGD